MQLSHIIRLWRLNNYDLARLKITDHNLLELINFDEQLFNKFRRINGNRSYGNFLLECGNIYLNKISDMNDDIMHKLCKLIIVHFSASDERVEPYLLILNKETEFIHLFLH